MYACCVICLVGSNTGNIDRIGTSSRGDVLFRSCVAELFARTKVASVENAGETARAGSGLAVEDLI